MVLFFLAEKNSVLKKYKWKQLKSIYLITKISLFTLLTEKDFENNMFQLLQYQIWQS
jgi:hypothetical protein